MSVLAQVLRESGIESGRMAFSWFVLAHCVRFTGTCNRKCFWSFVIGADSLIYLHLSVARCSCSQCSQEHKDFFEF